MAFKSLNFYLENLDDKSIIGSNSNSVSNSVSTATYSNDLTEDLVNAGWPLAVNESVAVVGHTNNVRIYTLSDLYGVTTRSTRIAMTANSISIDGEFIYLGSQTTNTVSKYDVTSVFYSNLTSAWANSSSSFGQVVKAKDGLVLVSAPNNFSNVGSVHLFDSRGAELAILKPNTTNQYTGFGTSIDLGDNSIVVGAPYDVEGRVYIYDYSGSLKKVISGPNVNSRFGYSVASGYSSILIGAPNATSTGGAYIYSPTGTEIKYIDVSSLGSTYHLGRYTSIESGKAVLFSTGDTVGYARIFSFDMRSNSYSQNGFGYSVDTRDGYIGLATSNGNVYVGKITTDFDPYNKIYAFSILKRKHLLEEPI